MNYADFGTKSYALNQNDVQLLKFIDTHTQSAHNIVKIDVEMAGTQAIKLRLYLWKNGLHF